MHNPLPSMTKPQIMLLRTSSLLRLLRLLALPSFLFLLASCGTDTAFDPSPLCQADLRILQKTPQRLGCFFASALPQRWIVQFRQGRFFFCSSPTVCDIPQSSIPRTSDDETFYVFFPPDKEIPDASDLSSTDRACQAFLQQKSKVLCQTGQSPDLPEDACWILLRLDLKARRSSASCDRLSSLP